MTQENVYFHACEDCDEITINASTRDKLTEAHRRLLSKKIVLKSNKTIGQ